MLNLFLVAMRDSPPLPLVGLAAGTLVLALVLARLLCPTPRASDGRTCALPPIRPGSGITGWFGLLGQLRTVRASKEHRLPLRMQALCEQMGDTWMYKLFGARTIITRDPRNIKAMLATQFEDFKLTTDRDAMHPLLGTFGIFTQSGTAWSTSRALLRPSFDRALVSDLSQLEPHFQRLTTRIAPANTNELQQLFKKLTMDSSSEFLLGRGVDVLSDDEKQRRQGARFEEAFDKAQRVIALRWALSNLYWMYAPREFRDACKVVREYVAATLAAQQQLAATSPATGTTDKQRYLFLDALRERTDDPRVLQDQTLSVLLAGRDTTAALLSWCVLCLARHPEVQARLRAAIAEVVGDRIPTQADLKAITYLRHVLNEVLRLYPPVFANTRGVARACTLPYGGGPDGTQPIALKPGDKVIASFFALHRKRDVWGKDAEEFRPERWGSAGSAEKDDNGPKVAWGYTPFNGGPRVCLGQQMALTHVGYFIVRLLQSYPKLAPAPDDPGHAEQLFDAKINMFPAGGVKVVLA